jgi:O-antigen ligase
MALAIVSALVSREFWQATPQLICHPVAVVAVLIFILLAIGTFYSSAPAHENINYLWRYKKLLLVPLLIPFFQASRFRYQALACFCLSTFLTVLASWSEFYQYTHISDPAFGDFTGDSVFVMHITQGFLFAMLIALAISLAIGSRNIYLKAFWLIIAVITVGDICFVMWGRTGKATLAVLTVWACWEWLYAQKWQWMSKVTIQLLCITFLLAGVGMIAKKPELSFGTIRTDLERAHSTGEATSQGLRYQFAKTGVKIFLKSPWVGHGTGSIVTEQSKFAKEAQLPVQQVVTVNLHNEYLMQAVQLGAMGIALFIGWLASAWYYSLNKELGWQAIALRGTIVVFAFGCLFNSYLWDHIEGYTYCLLLQSLIPIKKTRLK